MYIPLPLLFIYSKRMTMCLYLLLLQHLLIDIIQKKFKRKEISKKISKKNFPSSSFSFIFKWLPYSSKVEFLLNWREGENPTEKEFYFFSLVLFFFLFVYEILLYISWISDYWLNWEKKTIVSKKKFPESSFSILRFYFSDW